jgi:hypothetical protein
MQPGTTRSEARRTEPVRGGCEDAFSCRCSCGSQLARLVPGGVEIKCRRCKRTQLIPFGELPSDTP